MQQYENNDTDLKKMSDDNNNTPAALMLKERIKVGDLSSFMQRTFSTRYQSRISQKIRSLDKDASGDNGSKIFVTKLAYYLKHQKVNALAGWTHESGTAISKTSLNMRRGVAKGVIQLASWFANIESTTKNKIGKYSEDVGNAISIKENLEALEARHKIDFESSKNTGERKLMYMMVLKHLNMHCKKFIDISNDISESDKGALISIKNFIDERKGSLNLSSTT